MNYLISLSLEKHNTDSYQDDELYYFRVVCSGSILSRFFNFKSNLVHFKVLSIYLGFITDMI